MGSAAGPLPLEQKANTSFEISQGTAPRNNTALERKTKATIYVYISLESSLEMLFRRDALHRHLANTASDSIVLINSNRDGGAGGLGGL